MCSYTHGRNLNRQRNEWNIQKEFLEKFDGKPVNIIMINGFQMKCYINCIDSQVIIVTKPGETIQQDVQCMIYKHAVSTIEPAK